MADLQTNLQRLENNSDEISSLVTDISDAIIAKGGTLSENAGLRDFPTAIDSIPSSGGGGGGSSSDDVRFLDYDGTVVQSYSAADFANLSAMPDNPTHTGLTAQGWNWSLADAKTYVATYGSLNIGQMYVTDDGVTRLYITLPEGRTSPILRLYLNDNSELDIDWGDGSTHSTFTATSAGYKSERHEYSASGDYVIAITVVNGGFVLQSSSVRVSSILWNGNNSASSPDKAYNNAIQKIEIGNNVTSIGNYAFYYCYSLSSVTIPNSVTSIGSNAFYNCSSLSSVTIPNNVTSIGSNAFYNCSSLSSITISNNVTSIGQTAFQGCSSLSSITIPSSVTSIGIGAFQGCSSLSSVTIPDTVTSIGINTFASCSALLSVTIPNNVTGIGDSAFVSCYSLSSITIPDSVTNIGGYAFQSCYSLSSITIPNNVTSIGSRAFYECSYMSYIKFESTTPPTVSSSNAWANVSTSTVIYVPALVSNLYMNGTNYPAKASYTYIGYATYESGTALPTTTTDETYTLTWYATSADAIAQTNPITQGTGDEVYSRATPVA